MIVKRYIASDLKDMNRQTVYDLISSTGEISRAEISRKTGISSPTVIKIIDHFINLGIVSMGGEGKSRLGRKPQIIKFNPNAAYSLGIEFDSRFISIGIVNLLGEIISIKRYANKPDIFYMLKKKMVKYIGMVIKESGIEKNKILGIGIGIPGSVDPNSKIITLAPSFGVKDSLDVSSLIKNMEDELELTVILERDVYAAAKGEFKLRKSNGDRDLLFIFMGSGIGAGIILDGKLRRGGVHMAGEIGYLTFDITQKLDTTNLGWLENTIDKAMLLYKDKMEKVVPSISNHLSLAIAALSISLDIEKVVLGGPRAKLLGAPLYDSVNKKLAFLCLRNTQVSVPVCGYPAAAGLALIVTESKIDKLLEGIA
jgi:predicted NBD/HSP70 family sugar kinase